MEEKREYEDIVSNSNSEEFVDLSSMSSEYKKKNYKRKKRGIAGFFARMGAGISKWWRKCSKGQKAAVISLSSVIALLLVFVIFVLSFFKYNYNPITNNPEELGVDKIINEKIINIALFGIDSRSKDFKGNSDSIMILSLDTEDKQVKIISVMRDSLVPIEKNGKTSYKKINSAYASGGPELAIKTLNQTFGLDIMEYATVNFEGMMDIIDAVGGIEAELTSKEVVSASKNAFALNGTISDMCSRLGLNAKDYYITTPGKHHLNGVQAVAYSRIRKVANIWGTNNDHGRTDRQRYVMEQLFNKALKLDKSNYVKLAKALIPCSETSLSYSEIISLATDILLKSPTFEQSRIPLDEYQINKNVPNIKGVGSIVYYDLEYAKDILHAFIYDDIDPQDYMEKYGVEKNNWYTGAQIGSSSKPSSSSGSTTSSKPTTSSSKPTTSDTSSDVISGDGSDVEGTSSDETTSSEVSSETEGTTPPDEEDVESGTPPTSSEETTTSPTESSEPVSSNE